MSDNNYTNNPIFSSDSKTIGNSIKVDVTDLCYSVVVNGKMKRLLKNVCFNLDPGDLCALMGPSGAGKSTLLDLVAGRKLNGTWSGDVYINDAPRSHLFKRETAYVLQDDVHISTLTVEETLLYAAWTRLEEGTSLETRHKRVDELLSIMGLSHIRNSFVGDPMTKGISGGELKRLSIAVEIIPLQKLIFLDEPTSGLDSSIALKVMSAVRNFITKDRTAITTIHQPSRDVFRLFDKLVLLSAGRLIYFGAASEAVVYFTHPEVGYKFEGGFKNPAEFVIEISCGQRLPEGIKVAKQTEELEILYKSSRFYRPSNIIKKADLGTTWEEDNPTAAVKTSDLYATTVYTQIHMLLHRTWLAKIRDTNDIYAQVAKNVLAGVFLGAVWFGKGDLDEPLYENGRQTSDVSALNSLFFILLFSGIYGNIQAVPYLCSNTFMYRRELASNAYAPFPFWCSMVFTLIPLFFIFNLALVVIVYFMVNLPSSADYFFYFLCVVFLACFAGYATCLALAANLPSADAALKAFPLLFFFQSIYAGYAIKTGDLPVVWMWVPYISYLHYAFEGLMVNEYTRFDTDDYNDYAEDGDGDILSDFYFDNFEKRNSIWILLIFIGVFFALLYNGIRPPKSKLIKVRNAHDVVSVLSQSTSFVNNTNNNTNKGGYLKANDLQEGLISNGFEEQLVIQDPVIEHEAPMNIDYFRTTEGVTDSVVGCRVVFRNLSYKVIRKTDNVEITLLQGITGRINPGETCALMGASGAGKSTLLDVLGQRKNTGVITGEITYNGTTELKSFAYVMQDNVHIGALSVRESISYAAELRLKETMSVEKKAKRVQKIIDMLGLTKVSESPIGASDVRGISGGQLKRVSIGVEIVNLPNTIFLDEPTTGLDSSISLEVMSAVRNLANQNRTVICTIHQPSEDTFALFDTLILLARGKIIYFGSTSGMVTYFTNSPFRFKYETGGNPADFVVAVAGSFIPASDGRLITGADLVTYFTTTEQYSSSIEAADAKNNSLMEYSDSDTDNNNSPVSEVKYNTSTYHQCKVLLHRRFVVMRKEYKILIAQLARNVVLALLYGSIFFSLCTDSSDSSCYTNRLSLFFFTQMTVATMHVDSIGKLLIDRLVFYRERGAKAYGPFSYWLSTTIPVLLFQFPLMFIFTIIIYFMAGLRDGHYGYFFIIILLSNYTIMYLSFTLGAISSSIQVSLSLFPIVLGLNILYAGYLVYIPNMPGVEGTWLPYIFYLRYAFQGLVLNELQNNDDLTESHSYISELDFDTISVSGCTAIILIFLGCFAISYYVALRFINFEQR